MRGVESCDIADVFRLVASVVLEEVPGCVGTGYAVAAVPERSTAGA